MGQRLGGRVTELHGWGPWANLFRLNGGKSLNSQDWGYLKPQVACIKLKLRYIPHQGAPRVIRHAVGGVRSKLKRNPDESRLKTRLLLREVDLLLEHLSHKGGNWRALGPGQSDVGEEWMPL